MRQSIGGASERAALAMPGKVDLSGALCATRCTVALHISHGALPFPAGARPQQAGSSRRRPMA